MPEVSRDTILTIRTIRRLLASIPEEELRLPPSSEEPRWIALERPVFVVDENGDEFPLDLSQNHPLDERSP